LTFILTHKDLFHSQPTTDSISQRPALEIKEREFFVFPHALEEKQPVAACPTSANLNANQRKLLSKQRALFPNQRKLLLKQRKPEANQRKPFVKPAQTTSHHHIKGGNASCQITSSTLLSPLSLSLSLSLSPLSFSSLLITIRIL
jgi:hypothetical protein